jgi:hypothetical protein
MNFYQRPDAKPVLFSAADFSFDPHKQVYLCPQGKELTCHAVKRGRLRCLSAEGPVFEQTHHLPPVSLHPGGHTASPPDRRDEGQDRQRTGQADLRQTAGYCRTDVCQHLCAEAHESLYSTDQVESRCTIAVVRSGTQYWQDPHVGGDPLTPAEQITRRTRFDTRHGRGKALCKMSFSTVSLGTRANSSSMYEWTWQKRLVLSHF